MRIQAFLFLYFITSSLFSKDPYPLNSAIDIQHYKFSIELNDSTNVIDGLAEVTILFRKSLASFELDLTEKTNGQSGMTVRSIQWNNSAVDFSHANERLHINLNVKANQQATLKISYYGIPADGLIIGTNKFGDRTFFGDNWPNRAHHWLPTIDHPSDKASCEFIVTAPNHYQVIANGVLKEKTALAKSRMLTHWKEDAVLPTKVMVIGAARFATSLAGVVGNVPVETWVYPQNKEEGFYDFKIATQVLSYFTDQLGSFPFKKLANVQSTTRYGGMENASNIFYFENSVTGKNEREGLIAHEIAHQWFGDSASEKDWFHVWLSEGFATYMTCLYLEHTYGSARLEQQMKDHRNLVVDYFKKNPSPVIDTTITNINKVLNTNSYQKGAWFLHMLRKQVGDEAFWKGINRYYDTYQYSNALTSDFRAIMEKESNQTLEPFFNQWLYNAGHPQIEGTWHYNARKKGVQVSLKQRQSNLFTMPVEIQLMGSGGQTQVVTAAMQERQGQFEFPANKRPTTVSLDPGTWLLFEGQILEK